MAVDPTGIRVQVPTLVELKQQEKPASVEETSSGGIIDGFSDWINDEDKVCTDGKDDGKLSLGESALSFVKGLGGIVKTAIKHPVKTGLAVAGSALLIGLTGGAAAPILVAAGLGMGAVQVGTGVYKAATADSDAEAKQAFETMGNGAFAIGASMLGAKSAMKTASKNGNISSYHYDPHTNPLMSTVDCIKSIPTALKNSVQNVFNNLFYNVFDGGGLLLHSNKVTNIRNSNAKYVYKNVSSNLQSSDNVMTISGRTLTDITSKLKGFENVFSPLDDVQYRVSVSPNELVFSDVSTGDFLLTLSKPKQVTTDWSLGAFATAGVESTILADDLINEEEK